MINTESNYDSLASQGRARQDKTVGVIGAHTIHRFTKEQDENVQSTATRAHRTS